MGLFTNVAEAVRDISADYGSNGVGAAVGREVGDGAASLNGGGDMAGSPLGNALRDIGNSVQEIGATIVEGVRIEAIEAQGDVVQGVLVETEDADEIVATPTETPTAEESTQDVGTEDEAATD